MGVEVDPTMASAGGLSFFNCFNYIVTVFFFFADGEFLILRAALIPSGLKKSRVKPLWPLSGSISELNLQFLKRGDSGINTRTSNSRR